MLGLETQQALRCNIHHAHGTASTLHHLDIEMLAIGRKDLGRGGAKEQAGW
jgi:hypothetical protein